MEHQTTESWQREEPGSDMAEPGGNLSGMLRVALLMPVMMLRS